MTPHPTDLDTLLKELSADIDETAREIGLSFPANKPSADDPRYRLTYLLESLRQDKRTAEASALTARRDGERDGLLKAARAVVEMMEAAFADAELADTPGMSEACEQAGRHYADVVDALRTLASTVPGGEETPKPERLPTFREVRGILKAPPPEMKG